MKSKTRTPTRSAVLAVAAALLVTAAGPAAAEKNEKRQPIEKFRANAYSVNLGEAKLLYLTIYEWTTPEKRQALLQTFADGGSEALYKALDKEGEKANLRLPHALGYEMRYAFQVEVGGKRRIVLATDRPLGFLELARNARSTDYNVTLVVLDVDPETGEGEGHAIGGAELSVDKDGQLQIELPGTQPARLSKVKRQKIEKKDG